MKRCLVVLALAVSCGAIAEEEELIYNRVVNELNGSDDPALWSERNKALRELGLRTVARPNRK